MSLTRKYKSSKNKTYKKRPSANKRDFESFQKEVTVKFLEILLMIKLFHWKTTSYAIHKATDELYASFNEHMDSFVEVLLGKSGVRTDLMKQKTIKLEDLNSPDRLREKIESVKSYLVDISNNKTIESMTNTDLLSIRDEILGDMNKFLYLLTLK